MKHAEPQGTMPDTNQLAKSVSTSVSSPPSCDIQRNGNFKFSHLSRNLDKHFLSVVSSWAPRTVSVLRSQGFSYYVCKSPYPHNRRETTPHHMHTTPSIIHSILQFEFLLHNPPNEITETPQYCMIQLGGQRCVNKTP